MAVIFTTMVNHPRKRRLSYLQYHLPSYLNFDFVGFSRSEVKLKNPRITNPLNIQSYFHFITWLTSNSLSPNPNFITSLSKPTHHHTPNQAHNLGNTLPLKNLSKK